MRNIKRQLIAACVIALFGASVALACIPEFGWQLLNNRAATLDTMPVNNSFAFAAARLLPSPKDELHAAEPEHTGGDETLADALSQAEGAGLSSDEAGILRQMRAETSGDRAYDKGELLSASVRLYTAGAVDFHKGDKNEAIARFREILDLPANDRRDREVWAAYMLGRLYGSKGDVAKASKSFALTRDFVSEGAPDPLGLAVASYGEEARPHLDRARRLQKSKKMSAKQHELYGHEIASAVALYAEQAAHGSGIGIDSLQQVAYEVLGDDAAVASSICDPTVQQLLVDRLLADNAGPPEAYGSGSSGNSQLGQVVSAAQKCRNQHLVDADQLAAIAYRSGDFNLAHSLAIQTTSPLAMWVQARLAMQKGDVAEAAKFYAAASKAFPSSGDTSAADQWAQALLVGENGVLTLSRGEYVDALEQLYPYATSFWGDVAYIAERVLTVDELKTFVDTHKDTQFNPAASPDNPSTPPASPDESSASEPSDEATASEPSDSEKGPGPVDQLRDLLARRLVRAGRYQEALNYAPALEVKSSSTPAALPTVSPGGAAFAVSVSQAQSSPAIRPVAKPKLHRRRNLDSEPPNDAIAEYVQGLNDAKTARTNIDRARGWYRAAVLAGNFTSGNKIMGTEGTPDYFVQPALEGGSGPFALGADDKFISKGERQRYNDSAPRPNLRYHYIYVGANDAMHAADLLPPRSQAFAAVLCNATSWITDGMSCPVSAADLRRSPFGSETPIDASIRKANALQGEYEPVREGLTCQLYQRYLKAGAVVSWATDFGQSCPDPDFDSAIHFVKAQEIHEARRRSQMIHHRWKVLFQLALIALCLGASTWWFLRHRYV
jgi:tetratricopeptide (TPR) repeat protein